MKSGYSVSVITLWPVLEVVRRSGLDVTEVLSSAGIPLEVMADPTHRLTEASTSRLWNAAEEATSNPNIGLLAAEQVTVSSLDVFGFIWRTSATVGEAVHHACRHIRTLCDHVGLELELAERRARLEFTYLVPGRRSLRDYTVALASRFSHILDGGAHHHAQIYFEHAQPASIATYERVLTAPFQFGAERTYVEIDRSYLDNPLPGHDPKLREILERQADKYSDARGEASGLEDFVRRAIVAELAIGDASLARVARRLAMSPRTLSRKLLAAGTSHQRILDDLRHGLALRYLQDERRSVSEVTYLLGFAHPSAFNKAFRRWTHAR